MKNHHWERVLPEVLHSIRSLLCTATNETPHERFFNFQRRSSFGNGLPSWLLTPGQVLVRRYVRSSKHEPLTDQVELVDVNPMYASVKYPDGRESTVSIRDLAPSPESPASSVHQNEVQEHMGTPGSPETQDVQPHNSFDLYSPTEPNELRRSTRVSKPPDRYGCD